ncbi:MAG: hypothetical protein AABZ12_13010, partial [Planctomycetota bacterium]
MRWAGRRIGRWTLPATYFAAGALLLALSLDLHGAPLRRQKAESSDKAARGEARLAAPQSGVSAPASVADGEEPAQAISSKGFRSAQSGMKVIGPFVVDYRDDEPTRLRQAGLLRGPLPALAAQSVTAAVTVGCTFAVDCLDGDPCTTDTCTIAPSDPVGAGTCVHTPVTVGDSGGCDDGLFCNGLEFCNTLGECETGLAPTCCGGEETCQEGFGICSDKSLNPGDPCEFDFQCREGTCDRCRPDCRVRICSAISTSNAGKPCASTTECPGGSCLTNDQVCQDEFLCNGTETCNMADGQCVRGPEACGANADCDDHHCVGGTANGKACTSDLVCPEGTCEPNTVPVCSSGRCCANPNPAQCRKKWLANAPTQADACGGAHWYAGDTGSEDAGPDSIPCGGENPDIEEFDAWGCPNYSSGITQTTAAAPPVYPVSIGPISASPLAVQIGTRNEPLNRLGDDYSWSGGSYFGIDVLRFYGGMIVPNRLMVEFYDASGNFVEDIVVPPIATTAVSVIVVAFKPSLDLPPNGFVVIRVANNFSPNASFQWLSTDNVDVGGNDSTKLWVNDGETANFLPDGAAGILAFEMAGDALTAAPTGACCNATTGVCDSKVKWVCDGDLGVYQAGLPCSVCVNGTNAGFPCRTCQGGTEPGTFACQSQAECDARALDGTCQGSNSLCTVGHSKTCSNDPSGICTIDDNCPGISNFCSNNGRFCLFNSQCGVGGTCGGAGTCLAGTCQTLSCSEGACCLADGTCSIHNPTDCANLGGTFGDYGTNCEPNCCPQPYDSVNADIVGDTLYDNVCTDGTCWTGADQPADAIVHNITVPLPGSDPVVVSITGNNEKATSTSGDADTCWGVATSVFSEPGWWEAFHIDACAWVRLDLCCTKPIHEPAWAFISADTQCNVTFGSQVNPYKFAEDSSARGAPYCSEDNLWQWFGPLAAGTYYYSVHSQLQGHRGDYQLHVTVEPCPQAACCLPSTDPEFPCTDVLNEQECSARNGFFLAGENSPEGIPLCTGDPCAAGSCCTAPGVCKDAKNNNNNPMTATACALEGPQAKFTGGVQCRGGRCNNTIERACQYNADCPTGETCEGSDKALAQPNHCPICQ